MGNNFNLRKFLTENKLTSNSKVLKEEFKQEYVASTEEIRQFLEGKLSSKHDEHIVDEVYQQLFDGIESLVDEQPGTSELAAAYSISENLEDNYYEDEKDEHLAIAQEITKLLEPFFMASETAANEAWGFQKDFAKHLEKGGGVPTKKSDPKVLRVSMGKNAKQEQRVIDIARDAIALMDEQPGTSAEEALAAVLER